MTPQVTLRKDLREVHEAARFTLSNDLDELPRASSLATELLERCGAEEQTVYDTQLLLEELLSNVIRHGYRDHETHEIACFLRVSSSGVELEIVDDGQEFDPLRSPEVDLHVPLAQRRTGGMGIHLVRAFARDIRYERVGEKNFLRLRI